MPANWKGEKLKAIERFYFTGMHDEHHPAHDGEHAHDHHGREEKLA